MFFPQVYGCAGELFFCTIPRRASWRSNPLRPPLPPAKRVVRTMPLSETTLAGIQDVLDMEFGDRARAGASDAHPELVGV